MKKIHIQLTDDTQLWFTSDLHVGHRNVIQFCKRPFSDIKEMNEKLIENWNSVVRENDIVFILGDVFWFNDRHAIKKFLLKLNGIKYIVPGNHDDFSKYTQLELQNVVLCDDITQLFIEHKTPDKWSKKIYEVFLSHYPMMTWPHRENGAMQLFGHIHSCKEKRDGMDQDLPLHKNQCDVGVDYWDYAPVNFETLLNILT